MTTANPKAGRRAPLILGALVLAIAASGSFSSVAQAADSPASHTFNAIAIGIPDLNRPSANRAGGLDVYLTDGTKQQLTEQSLGLVVAGKGDYNRFGASAIVARLNADAYPDLIVGAPGAADKNKRGKVVLLFGSAAGITAEGMQVLTGEQLGDEFGAAVVMSGRTLYVGAPGYVEELAPDVGLVRQYAIDDAGKATPTFAFNEINTPLGGSLQANLRFGAVLAPADDGVIVGLPLKNLGKAIGAGEMIRYRSSVPHEFSAEIWTQDSPGIPGAAEAGDHFGAAVTEGGYVVGVPGEDVAGTADAGALQTFRVDPAAPSVLTPSVSLTQDGPGVPGAVEAGDRFGAAVVSGIFTCQEATSVAIGSPGEDLGSAADAGSVTLVGLPVHPGDLSCDPTGVRQGRGLPGAPETGDRTGASLGRVGGDDGLDEDLFDTLLIGAPGEDIGTGTTGRNTGRAMIRGGLTSVHTQSFGYQGGTLPSLAYGTVFSSEDH